MSESAASAAAVAMLPKYPGEAPRDLSKPLERLKILIDARLDGQRLDLALAAVLPWRSRASIHRLIAGHHVRLDDREVPASRRVRVGETIVVDIPPERVASPDPGANVDFPILYEDRWMVAVDKPPGLAVHPSGRRVDGTLIHALHRRYRNPDDQARDVVPRLLHRIDVETSGVVAVGLDEQFHYQVARQFEDREVKKTYLAVVHGRPESTSGTIELALAPDKKSSVRLKLTTTTEDHGLSAVTAYRVLRSNADYSLIEVAPRTGRTHQIRVHMAAIGCPLVGDKLYGGKEDHFLHMLAGTLTEEHRTELVLDRHALHSHTLTFFHPMLGRQFELVAPLPADMAALIPDDSPPG
ncbi:MAG: RluA family pseudouridine synthase [Planctomycetes bacterium]|nr:RluA family pseudouridine synthase [Planctomycetota bacterium]